MNSLVGEGVRNLLVCEGLLVSPRKDLAKWPDPMEIPAMAPPINYGLAEPMTSQGYSINHWDLRKIKSIAQNVNDQGSKQGQI